MTENVTRDIKEYILDISGKFRNKIQDELHVFRDLTNSEFSKKSLELLFKLLKDTRNVKDVTQVLLKLQLVDPKTVLEAFIETHGTHQKTAKIPVNLNELRSIMLEAAKGKQKIKAVGTRYSGLWTDIGNSKGIIIDTSRLTAASSYIECLKGEHIGDKNLYNFEAGITMGAIQEKLWPSEFRTSESPEKFRVLENATSGAGLSLAGTVSTGAHGNGINTKIVADAVASFQMFSFDSQWRLKRYQIEPKEGITDPKKFHKKHQFDDDHFELIQNDEQFNASVVNIGCMGVVYSYVLRTVPGFYLEEERTVYRWSEAKTKITELFAEHEQGEKLYNFQVIGSPYKYKLDPDGEEAEYRVLISVLRRATFKRASHRPAGRSPLPLQFLDKALVAAGNSTPHLIPLIMHYSLMYLEHEKVVINAVEALNTLSGVVAETFSDVRTSECSMKLKDGPRTVTQVMETLHRLYASIRSKKEKQLVNVPIAMRFTAKSDKYMAMSYDTSKPTITIEQSIINGTLDADDTLKQFRDTMREAHEGRPHWGLLQEMDNYKLSCLYNSDEFKKARTKFDPNHVFENAFIKKVFEEKRQKNTSGSKKPRKLIIK